MLKGLFDLKLLFSLSHHVLERIPLEPLLYLAYTHAVEVTSDHRSIREGKCMYVQGCEKCFARGIAPMANDTHIEFYTK